MKPSQIVVLVLAALVADSRTPVMAAQDDEEQKLIQVLKSGASPSEMDAACARLKRIGTPRSVPALSALLRDDQLSHSARYALESLQAPEAEAALLVALDSTTGLTQIGIINSLGFRGEPQAVPALAALLKSSESATATAAATALGQIGGPEALKSLQKAMVKSPGKLHDAIVESLLHCASSLLAARDNSKALSVFEKLYNDKEKDYVRLAAYRGLILASGDAGLRRMTHAITGERGPDQAAALQLVRQLQVEGATREFAELLPKVRPEVQIALVEGLAQRGDSSAVPQIATLAGSAGPEVRPSILNALGLLGDASVVPLLSRFAASDNLVEQSTARRALAELRGPNVTQTLLSQLATASPSVQVELARALGSRGDKSAVPKLLDLAAQPADSVRKASLTALAQLIEQAQLPSLVQLVLAAQHSASRFETAEALNSAYQRFQTRRSPPPVAALVSGLKTGSPEARVALLPICSLLPVPEIRTALRTALEDPDSRVREAAVRALCDTIDIELLEDVVNVARLAKEQNLRTLAFAGGVRLVAQEENPKIPRDQQVAVLKSLLSAASTPEQKRMVLAGLAEIPVPDALMLVEPLLDDDAVKNEAARAAVKIGLSLPSLQARSTTTVLKKALESATDNTTRQAVEIALKQVEASADYITDWQVAGPYRQAGKDYAALFDVAFPPEVGDGSGADWRTLPAATDPQRPWLMDLLKTLGGEQCVAYARTWIRSDKDQAARLELGTDDGVKAWLNDQQIYALNTARALHPGSDRVNVTLHSGWNRLLLKVTQNNQGWEFCARFLKPDGSHLEGLQCRASARVGSSSGQ